MTLRDHLISRDHIRNYQVRRQSVLHVIIRGLLRCVVRSNTQGTRHIQRIAGYRWLSYVQTQTQLVQKLVYSHCSITAGIMCRPIWQVDWNRHWLSYVMRIMLGDRLHFQTRGWVPSFSLIYIFGSGQHSQAVQSIFPLDSFIRCDPA